MGNVIEPDLWEMSNGMGMYQLHHLRPGCDSVSGG